MYPSALLTSLIRTWLDFKSDVTTHGTIWFRMAAVILALIASINRAAAAQTPEEYPGVVLIVASVKSWILKPYIAKKLMRSPPKFGRRPLVFN